MKTRLYQSEAWMTRQFVVLKLSEEEIAKKAGCSRMTVHTYLKHFGLIKKR